MRWMAVAMAVALAGCGGGTTGTNYSDAPPMAEIVATPTPKATPAPEAAEADAEPDNAAVPASDSADNLANQD